MELLCILATWKLQKREGENKVRNAVFLITRWLLFVWQEPSFNFSNPAGAHLNLFLRAKNTSVFNRRHCPSFFRSGFDLMPPFFLYVLQRSINPDGSRGRTSADWCSRPSLTLSLFSRSVPLREAQHLEYAICLASSEAVARKQETGNLFRKSSHFRNETGMQADIQTRRHLSSQCWEKTFIFNSFLKFSSNMLINKINLKMLSCPEYYTTYAILLAYCLFIAGLLNTSLSKILLFFWESFLLAIASG